MSERDLTQVLPIVKAARRAHRNVEAFKAQCKAAGILIPWGDRFKVYWPDVVRMLATPPLRKHVSRGAHHLGRPKIDLSKVPADVLAELRF